MVDERVLVEVADWLRERGRLLFVQAQARVIAGALCGEDVLVDLPLAETVTHCLYAAEMIDLVVADLMALELRDE